MFDAYLRPPPACRAHCRRPWRRCCLAGRRGRRLAAGRQSGGFGLLRCRAGRGPRHGRRRTGSRLRALRRASSDAQPGAAAAGGSLPRPPHVQQSVRLRMPPPAPRDAPPAAPGGPRLPPPRPQPQLALPGQTASSPHAMRRGGPLLAGHYLAMSPPSRPLAGAAVHCTASTQSAAHTLQFSRSVYDTVTHSHCAAGRQHNTHNGSHCTLRFLWHIVRGGRPCPTRTRREDAPTRVQSGTDSVRALRARRRCRARLPQLPRRGAARTRTGSARAGRCAGRAAPPPRAGAGGGSGRG